MPGRLLDLNAGEGEMAVGRVCAMDGFNLLRMLPSTPLHGPSQHPTHLDQAHSPLFPEQIFHAAYVCVRYARLSTAPIPCQPCPPSPLPPYPARSSRPRTAHDTTSWRGRSCCGCSGRRTPMMRGVRVWVLCLEGTRVARLARRTEGVEVGGWRWELRSWWLEAGLQARTPAPHRHPYYAPAGNGGSDGRLILRPQSAVIPPILSILAWTPPRASALPYRRRLSPHPPPEEGFHSA